MTDILDIEGILTRPWESILFWSLVILVFFLLLFLIIGGIRLIRKRRRNKEERGLPPHETFFLELNRLDQQKLLEKGATRKYYFFLSEAMRRYLWERFQIRALDETTVEIARELESLQNVDVEQKSNLLSFLEKADQVKFADLNPGIEEGEKDREILVLFVNNTVVS